MSAEPQPLPSLSPAAAAAVLRDAVDTLSRGMPVTPGDLVPAVTPERTRAVVQRLEGLAAGDAAPRGAAAGFSGDDVATVDGWIRLADSFSLHDDPDEAGTRAILAGRLRAVRALVAPGDVHLTGDPRDGGSGTRD